MKKGFVCDAQKNFIMKKIILMFVCATIIGATYAEASATNPKHHAHHAAKTQAKELRNDQRTKMHDKEALKTDKAQLKSDKDASKITKDKDRANVVKDKTKTDRATRKENKQIKKDEKKVAKQAKKHKASVTPTPTGN